MAESSGVERIEIDGLDELRLFARKIASDVVRAKRLLLLLNGAMGAGKTQFTKFLVEELGSGEACSPSFAIHNSYETKSGSVEHMDLYRLESEDDLESTGFWDFFRAKEGVVIIEWANRLSEMGLDTHLPRTWTKLEISLSAVEGEPEKRNVELIRTAVA